jgi:ubiquinone/menaquinone biosynthesis C-methylase UbiE
VIKNQSEHGATSFKLRAVPTPVSDATKWFEADNSCRGIGSSWLGLSNAGGSCEAASIVQSGRATTDMDSWCFVEPRPDSAARLDSPYAEIHEMKADRARVAANADRFSGFAELYDRYRPRPPELIVDLLMQLSSKPRPVVVDLGSGSGLSTLIWTRCAVEVVGVEPNADMRAQAELRAAGSDAPAGVRFVEGLSTATGLPDRYADIVTCSQSLHWMEPAGTFAEVARILRDGGVFGAYDCDWPPTFNPEAEQAYIACRLKAETVRRERRLAPDVREWNKSGHLERMRHIGRFRYVREVVLHHVESGGAERLVGLALSQGEVATLLKHGVSEDEIGITALRDAAHRALGDAVMPWFWSYRLRLGVK